MSNARARRMADWTGRPLCRKYAAVVFDRVVIGQSACRQEGRTAFGWALGALSDGQTEVLGWWQHSESAPVEWSMVGTQLAARGVERIRVVVDHSGVMSCLGSFSVPTVPEQACPIDAGKPAHALPMHVQRRVDGASATAKRIQAALTRAVRGRSIAEGEIAAAEFVDDTLQRIDRKLWAQVAGAASYRWSRCCARPLSTRGRSRA